MTYPGSKRQRQKARRRLTITLTHPSGLFRVTGGRRPHEVTARQVPGGFEYLCGFGDCPGGPTCSHILAVMMHLEPQRLSAQTVQPDYMTDTWNMFADKTWGDVERERPRAKKYQPNPNVPGHVYIVREPTGGRYKIGCSANVKKRLEQLNNQLPSGRLEVVLLLPTNARYALEADLHARFARQKSKNEWFNLSADDLEALRKEYVR